VAAGDAYEITMRYHNMLSSMTVLCVTAACLPAQAVRIHVSHQGDDASDGSANHPLASIPAAQLRVRDLLSRGHASPVEVLIAGGTWRLNQPLVFDHRDASAQAPVTYRSAPGEQAVLSGGLELSNWRLEGDFWTAPLPETAEPLGKPRQLLIDNALAPPAMEPDEGFFRVARAGPDRRNSFHFSPEGFVQPTFPGGVELVFLHDWSVTRVGLKEVDPTARLLTFEHPIGGDHDFFAIDGFEPHARYRLENDRAFADTTGEWFYDSERRQLVVRAGSNRSEPPRAILPQLSSLVRFAGTAERPVQGLTLANLEFRQTRGSLPSAGAAEVQAGFFQPRGEPSMADGWLNQLAPAVELAHAQDCTLRDCHFEQLGGGGIYVHRQSHRNRILACRFSDIGGSGVMIGDLDPPRSERGERLVCRDNRLSDSDLSACGRMLPGSVGVWIGIAAGTKVDNNEIHSLPYTGISVGWQWNPEPTGCENNQIIGNHIHHVMQLLSDGGGIYTLGHQPGTVLRDNRIHDVPLNAGQAESNGIFLDEGSSQMLVTGNEIYATARAPIRFHKAQDLVVRDNRLHLAPGITPFTYNATDPARILTEPNELVVEER